MSGSVSLIDGYIDEVLKPCPFCGGEAEYVGNGDYIDVSCKDFRCRGWADSLNCTSKKEAIEAWNRRVNE